MRRSRQFASGPRHSHRDVGIPPSEHRPTTKVRPKLGTIRGIAREARLPSSPCFTVRQATSSKKRKPRHHSEHREISTPSLHDRRFAAAVYLQSFFLKQNRISPVGPPGHIADRSPATIHTVSSDGAARARAIAIALPCARGSARQLAVHSYCQWLVVWGLHCGKLVIHGTS